MNLGSDGKPNLRSIGNTSVFGVNVWVGSCFSKRFPIGPWYGPCWILVGSVLWAPVLVYYMVYKKYSTYMCIYI